MNDGSNSGTIPVEVIFGGCQPDRRTVSVCLEAARAATLPARQVDACEIVVHKHLLETEIEIDVRTAEGDVIIDRFAVTPGEERLRAALRDGFDRIGRGIAPVSMPTTSRIEVRRVEPPPCIWLG